MRPSSLPLCENSSIRAVQAQAEPTVKTIRPNYRPALDAAMRISLHFGGLWRRASEAARYAQAGI